MKHIGTEDITSMSSKGFRCYHAELSSVTEAVLPWSVMWVESDNVGLDIGLELKDVAQVPLSLVSHFAEVCWS